jgi:cytochrome c peroxidase
VINAGAQIRCFTLDPDINDCIDDPNVLKFLEDVETFNANDNIEIRGQAPTLGQPSLGVLGFNVPSLLGIAYTAPYLHNGKARSLQAVFSRHALGNGTIDSELSGQQVDNLIELLNSIDGSTAPFDSETDTFLDSIGD